MTATARREARRRRGAEGREVGRAAEAWAALWLMLHGWRVLAFRLQAPGAEIDILARRGDVLAVVEVKRRATLDRALEALHPAQAARLLSAGQAVQASRPALRGLALRLDTVALAPGRWPRHSHGVHADAGERPRR